MAVPDHRVKSLETAFRVVETLDRHERMGVTEIARETGISKSSVYKHLDTLRHLGYATKNDEGYALSFQWFRTGRRVRERERVYQLACPELDRLARRTGETASLVVEEGGDAVYLYQVCEAEPAAPVPEGERIPALRSAGGKAIYSYRPIEEAEALVAAADLDLDADGLVVELQALRDQRLVIERNEHAAPGFSAGAVDGHRHVAGHDGTYRDIQGIAVPIRTPDGYGVAALEVTGSAASLSGRRLEEEIASLLVSAGKSVETDLVQQE